MITIQIQHAVSLAVQALFGTSFPPHDVQVQETRKEFNGQFTVVVFPLLKYSRKSPQETAEALGAYLQNHMSEVAAFEVVKGFLNLSMTDAFWRSTLSATTGDYWQRTDSPRSVMVEYSSPNTNKPLHLGHVRNILLGYSTAEILKARGNEVLKANLVNDRGIHICKSMLAWERWGNGETPASSGMKGDHLIGKYYVLFEKALQEQAAPILDAVYSGDLKYLPESVRPKIREWLDMLDKTAEADKLTAIKDEIKELVRSNTSLMLEARELLRQWEAGNPDVIHIWITLNNWVYQGFDETYKSLGVDFDQCYFESNTYILGKEVVVEGLEKGVFFKKPDGSVWVDLTSEGLDEKLLLRSDGTSVYITQDLGTADQRFDEFHLNQMIYVVGNEQEYHFKVLKAIFKKLGRPWYDSIFHLSYGMVELPSGKMKSREGTVVDADDLIAEMIAQAKIETQKSGKTENLDEAELQDLYRKIGLAGLKFYMLKADPRRQMLFNPEESIDLHGFTGTYIQYVYARIRSILRKATENAALPVGDMEPLMEEEMELLQQLYKRNEILAAASENLSPALLANYIYETARTFNKFYDKCPVLREPDTDILKFRLLLLQHTAECLSRSCALLGIELPEKM
jgi:arginyl-tRNA synthetase